MSAVAGYYAVVCDAFVQVYVQFVIKHLWSVRENITARKMKKNELISYFIFTTERFTLARADSILP